MEEWIIGLNVSNFETLKELTVLDQINQKLSLKIVVFEYLMCESTSGKMSKLEIEVGILGIVLQMLGGWYSAWHFSRPYVDKAAIATQDGTVFKST